MLTKVIKRKKLNYLIKKKGNKFGYSQFIAVKSRYPVSIKKEIIDDWIKSLINRIRLEIRYRKKLKELRKRDPFIYK